MYEGRFFSYNLNDDLVKSYDCRLARAKYCKVTGGNAQSLGVGMGCQTTKVSEDNAYSISLFIKK